MNEAQLKAACIKKVNEAFDLADKYYGKVMPRCPVEFNSRMTSCGGVARSIRWYGDKFMTPTGITISLPLLKLNGQAFIDEVPAHEVAHLVDGFHHNGTGHGRSWQTVMRRVMKMNTGRTHSFITPKKTSRKTSQLFCKCPTPHNVTPALHRKVQEGIARYKCKKCGTHLMMGKDMPQGIRIEDAIIQIAASHKAVLGTDYKKGEQAYMKKII